MNFKKKNNKKLSEKEGLFILSRQIEILKIRDKSFKNITLNDFGNIFREN